MPDKRKRAPADEACRSAAVKRSRNTAAPDLLSPLSDELLVRILSYLPLQDLLNLAPVSDRFYHLSGDSQIWKRLYYSRFVLPRALRLPGFRDGSARDGKLHYSSRRTVWADGRKGGWVDMRSGVDGEKRNWKKQYKLRHNWARGKCAVEELPLEDGSGSLVADGSPKVLVKVLEGIAVTADAATGLRAWDLRTKQLLAQVALGDDGRSTTPSCMDLDDQSWQRGTLDIATGFTDGSFGTWQLNTSEKQITQTYRHEESSNGEIIGISFLYPYVLTATSSALISLYTFDKPQPSRRPERAPEGLNGAVGGASLNSLGSRGRSQPHTEPSAHSTNDTPPAKSPAPYLLTSLKSHSARAPLALALRKTSGSTVASIAYTFSTLRGWSLGIQELHIHPPKSQESYPDITTTQLAYTLPVEEPSKYGASSPARRPRSVASHTDGNVHLDGPISLSYTHPYLLATLPDNTLVLHLCTSSSSLLSISPGIRLWGHTSGISDAEITARGKAVSVSCRGEEIRVWELEGRAHHGRSVEVRPTVKGGVLSVEDDRDRWDERRNWVGFDDEMVIVLKESNEGRESLLVYDFT
ncbi:hypothetical protein F5Y17DRAFT_386369 [Xylariaceae sp. FL0594]|nr:hypothetical protein F5Y17DRAFT_386369 [Xylariaceae sp. FL0594]